MNTGLIRVQTDHRAAQGTVGRSLCELVLERKENLGSERIFVELRNLVCSRTVDAQQACWSRELRGEGSKVNCAGQNFFCRSAGWGWAREFAKD